MLTRLLAPTLFALAATMTTSQALLVPFTENFASGASNWLNGSSAAPDWSATGGVDGGGYISAPGAISSGGFGTIVFRGNASADASGDAFVGDWLGGLLGMNRLLDGLLGSIVSATLGALVILWAYNKWFKK